MPLFKLSKNLFSFAFCITLLCSSYHYSPAHAEELNTWIGTDSETPIENLRLYKQNTFRIFYYTKGENQVILTDNDSNNVPDYVEDVAKQFWASKHIFCDILGFHDPIGHKYYKDVEFVDIYILKSDALKGANGIAINSPQQALLRPEGKKAVIVYLSKGFNFKSSSTITHEYFHIIQNSESRIKNLWYIEGMARWAEDALLDKNYQKNPRWNYHALIKNKDILNHVLSMSYDAGQFFWVPLSLEFGKSKSIDNDHKKLLNTDLIYSMSYSDGTKVFQDHQLAGADLIKIFLENLGEMDKEIEKDYNFTTWTRQESSHKRNNAYILKALEKSIAQYHEE